MDSSKKSNSSCSQSIKVSNETTSNVENESFAVVSTKKRKLSPCDEGSESVTAMLPGLNSTLSPEEFVFSINHILEFIFQNCDQNTLLNCRLVSHRWAYYGSKELQKSVIIRFGKSLSFDYDPPIFRFTSQETRYIEDLATLINTSAEFPCNSFAFQSTNYKSETCRKTAQAFFNSHGAFVKKLIFRQDVYIEDLKHLLLNQAPNLQQLHLGPIDLYSDNFDVTNGVPLFCETTMIPKPVMKNLKIFRCHSLADLPRMFTQQILECSPNLVGVALPYCFPCLLVQPKNRIHLLKRLYIYILSANIASYELLANHLQDNGNRNLAVQDLHFIGADYEVSDVGVETLSERVTDVMRKILKACSATCQMVSWKETGGIKNLQIPQMPRVKHLTIQYCKEDVEIDPLVCSLPEDVSLGNTFPNLKSLEIRSYYEIMYLPIPRIFSDEDPTPAANVEKVTLRLVRLGRKVFESVKEMFPNASIWVKGSVYRSYGDGENIDGESECD